MEKLPNVEHSTFETQVAVDVSVLWSKLAQQTPSEPQSIRSSQAKVDSLV